MKKKFSKAKKSKYFEEMMRSYVIIICMFTLLVCAVYLFLSGMAEKTRRENYIKANLENQASQLEAKFDQCNRFLYRICSENEFISYAAALKKSGGEAQTEATFLHKKIQKDIMLTDSIGMNLAIISPDYDCVIQNGTKNIKNFLKDINVSESDFESISNSFKKSAYDTNIIFSFGDNMFIVKKYKKADAAPLYVAGIFSVSNLFYSTAKSDFSNGAVCLLYNDKFFSGVKTEDYKTDEIFKNIHFKKNKTGNYINTLSKGSIRIFYSEESSQSGLRYAYIAKKKNLDYVDSSSVFIVLIILFGLLTTGFYVSKQLAKKMYLPINNILTMITGYIDTPGESDSEAYDEIGYLRKKITSIMADNENFKESAAINKAILKERFLEKLIHGYYINQDIKKLFETNGVEYLAEGARVVIVQPLVKETDGGEFFSKKQISEITKLISVEFKKEISKSAPCEITEIDFYTFAVIMPVKDDIKAKKIISDVFDNSGHGIEIIAAIGGFCCDITDLVDSYETASVLINTHLINPSKNIFTPQDTTLLNREWYFYPLETEKNLINSIIAGKRDDSEKILKHILKTNLIDNPISDNAKTEFQFAIVSTVKRILQQLEKTESEVFSEGSILYLELKSCGDNTDLCNKIMYIFTEISNRVQKEHKDRANNTYTEIMNFISGHFTEDISLQDIANEFDISVTYAGKLISSHLNIGFKSYLNSLRINRAKEILLSQPQIKISALPEMLGYNNSVTFLRVFKKYEGISPSEFIKLNTENSKLN